MGYGKKMKSKGHRHSPGNPAGVGYGGGSMSTSRHTPGNPGKSSGGNSHAGQSRMGMKPPAGHPGSGGHYGGTDAPIARVGRYPQAKTNLGDTFKNASHKHKMKSGSWDRKAYTKTV